MVRSLVAPDSHRSVNPNLKVKTQYPKIATKQRVHIKVMHLNYPETTPPPLLWKNCLPQNQSLVPRSLGTTAL